MKIIVVLSVMTILLVGGPQAALSADVQKKVTATWTYDAKTVAADGIVGFRMRDAANKILADNIPVTERTVTTTITTGDKACQSFYLTAFTVDDEARPSNILTWCPPRRTLTGVGTFTIEVMDP